MIALFAIGLLLHALNLVLPAFVRDSRRLNVAANGLNALALLCGLGFSLNALLNYHPAAYRFALPVAGPVVIGFDGLSLFFLFTFQLLSLAGSLFAIGYLRHYIERGLSVRAHLWFFTLLIVSLQLLVISHNALVLLVVWEFMAVGAYFSIVFEKDKADVRRGGFWYFVATHAGVLLLYVCFLTLHEATGSWNFDDFARHAAYDPGTLAVVLLTGFAGFGIKAGFMPFHVWLPNAHPAAPAHVSGLLSAINIKTGIYGIARLMLMLPALDAAYGWGLLAVSVVSAVLGVWYALAQHDIKKLLAYHSVENIGIIGMGLSVAWLGRCYALPELVVLGFAGALLHTLNHAIFKGLLFFGAGNVTLHARGADIERMGGLARVIPFTATAFLVGAISICGLPPFNGFASEFLIYKSFFRGGDLLRGYAPLVMLCSAVGLAFMGGLAVACFTKLHGIVFLGQNRSGAASRREKETVLSSVVLLGLAGLCALLGIFPQTGLRLLAPALGELAGAAQAPAGWASPLGKLQIVFALFLALAAAVFVVKLRLQRRAGVRLRETWGCGYAPVTARMQYTASSFAEELVKLGRPLLDLSVHWKPLLSIVPVASGFRSHCSDRLETAWLAFHRAIGLVLGAFRWIQSGNIRHYVLYMFGAVAFYLLCALVW
ncbi:MAG: proton-conducting transporter membrane subunit [Terrimicrobiaceae bacterium]|nr:proton-conducting transporter membrane subunit [Terrimicrobiaceae bacterium]